jgi:V8-like Glu-specific endopeptidase
MAQSAAYETSAEELSIQKTNVDISQEIDNNNSSGFITDCPSDISTLSQPDATVLQWINGVYHKWREHLLADRRICIELVLPRESFLLKKDAQYLLNASQGWADEYDAQATNSEAYSISKSSIVPAWEPNVTYDPVNSIPDASVSNAQDEIETTSPLNTNVNNSSESDVSVHANFLIEPPTSNSLDESVHGADDRVEVDNTQIFPWNTISYLSYKKSDGSSWRCTGFLISPHAVLTNGHCVFSQDLDTWHENMVVYPGQYEGSSDNVQRPYGSRTYLSLASNDTYTQQNGDSGYDYGAVKFTTPFSGISTFIPLRFGYDLDNDSTTLNISGYPGTAQGISTYAQWHDSGTTSSTSDNRVVKYDMDSSGGQSGSPVWIYFSSTGERYVVAVHNHGGSTYNGGPRLTSNNQSIIEGWASWVPASTFPDLIISNFSSSATDVAPSETFTLNAMTRNEGGISSASTMLRYFRSTNSTISTSDTEVCRDSVGSLAAGESESDSCSISAPASAGVYYYGACVTAVSGESNTSNQCSPGVRITANNISQIGLDDALDNNQLSWSVSGDALWYGQTGTTYTGGKAAQSGAITHNQSSFLETSTTTSGTLTFYWKVSSETKYDYLRFYIDGMEQSGAISGSSDWSLQTYQLAEGVHSLRWSYTKDGSISVGADAGWVDKVEFSTICAATFSDVPCDYWAHQAIEAIFDARITSGCGGSNYCPSSPVSRAQMAVFLLRGMYGGSYLPPPASGFVFSDVSMGSFADSWIEQLAEEGITGGCGNAGYCPSNPITRAQMAVFLLRAKYGSNYHPPSATGTRFADVSQSSFAADWIEQLAREGVTSGCGNNRYCPNDVVQRSQMAEFLVRTFNL